MTRQSINYGRPFDGMKLLRVLATITLIALLAMNALAEEDQPSVSPPPGNHRLLSDSGFAKVPFDIYRGDIRFRGEINGREVHLLLDDGFMWDQILFWGSPQVDSLGLTYDGEISIGNSDDADAIPSKTASGITVNFPGVEFTDQTAIITPYSSGTSTMWSGSVGQVSGTFLKHFVVDINFDEMVITLIEPDKFVYRGGGVEIPWKPMGFGPWAIPATLVLSDGRTTPLDLMMDLGYNDQLQVSTTGEHKIPVPEKSLPASLGFNIQGTETRGYLGRMPQVDIGGYKINDVIVSYVSKEHSGNTFHEVMVGLGLLSRFNLVFDYSRQRMFIEPNNSFAEPFECNMSGVEMSRVRGEYRDILRVYPGSPGAEAGLQAGDKVVEINGRPVTEYDTWTLQPLMQQEGKIVSLAVVRDDKRMEVSLTLRRLI